jgi:hypothetical protein
MTLDKAIGILRLTPEYTEDGEPIGEADARKLGIEALERIKYMRRVNDNIALRLLPNETKI